MPVSAILCVHDNLAWLPQALESIAGQRRKVDELLLVKSGRTPPQADVLAKKHGARAVVQPAPGLAAARNFGIELARHDVLAFLDSDDLWEKDKTGLQLQRLEGEELAAVAGQLIRFSEEPGAPCGAARFSETVPAMTPGGLLVRKSVFEKIGCFDTRYRIACDHEWFMRLTASGLRWQKCPEVVLRKRIHPGSLSNQTAEYRREIMDILKMRHS